MPDDPRIIITKGTHLLGDRAGVGGEFVELDTRKYNETQEPSHREVCDLLAREIDGNLPGAENKIWHAHPVWFLEGNPTVGYSRQKRGIRLMFWSGADFGEAGLNVRGQKFKDASIFLTVFLK